MRVAVLLEDRCQPKKCNAECEAFCPPNRNGIECIVMHEGTGKPIVSEPLCIGCGTVSYTHLTLPTILLV